MAHLGIAPFRATSDLCSKTKTNSQLHLQNQNKAITSRLRADHTYNSIVHMLTSSTNSSALGGARLGTQALALAPAVACANDKEPMWSVVDGQAHGETGGSALHGRDAVDISKSRKLLKKTSQSQLTPRKRALARKASQSTLLEPSARDSPALSTKGSVEEMKGCIDEDKSVLFEYTNAEIFTFEEMPDTNNQSHGRLLGHGRFELFQLHQKAVSYLQCGSVVYPILPKLKILKISKNQFILPLANPERYWRIVLHTANDSIINDLESSLKSICQFRNLFLQSVAPPTPPTIAPMSRTVLSESSPIRRNVSMGSMASISTAVACFNLESESGSKAYVDDNVFLQDCTSPLKKTKSNASSLELALDSFFEEHEQEVTNYYTPDASVQRDSSPNILLASNLRTRNHGSFSRSSRSMSLYQSESSWMDPSDDYEASTPRTEKYIKLNLNPMAKERTRDNRIVTDPIFRNSSKNNKKNPAHRYSSYDVYNMLGGSSMEENSDSSFRGFLKSFF